MSERGAARCRLYLITPPAFDAEEFAPKLEAALTAGDVAAMQLRLKRVEEAVLLHAIAVLRPIAQAHGVAFLLNDRPDLTQAGGCDGAHVGQEDMGVRQARRLLGPERTLGVSCHASRHLAMEAGEAGADYVAFGSFFPSTTKETPARASPEILQWWSELMEIPSVAIGGITPANCAPLVRAGADFLAVISAVWNHAEGPTAGVREMNEAIARAR